MAITLSQAHALLQHAAFIDKIELVISKVTAGKVKSKLPKNPCAVEAQDHADKMAFSRWAINGGYNTRSIARMVLTDNRIVGLADLGDMTDELLETITTEVIHDVFASTRQGS